MSGGELFVQLLVAALHLLHERLQLRDDLGQRIGLALQGGEGVVAVLGGDEGGGEGAQRAGGVLFQRAGHVGAFAAGDGGHEAQHGRAGHTGHRGAEGNAQAFDGRCQRAADGAQIGRAFEREHGALEGDHHAQKGAQHAEHDQQADEVGRERQARQCAAPAFHALAHSVLQRRGHAGQPVGEAAQRLRDVGERIGQTGAGAAEAADFERAQQVGGGDGHGHAQGEPAGGADEAHTHPGDGEQAEQEGADEQGAAGKGGGRHGLCFQRLKFGVGRWPGVLGGGFMSPRPRSFRRPAADGGPTRRAGPAPARC
ncbi:hypothetical protein D9M69_515750 [compost metagenome]